MATKQPTLIYLKNDDEIEFNYRLYFYQTNRLDLNPHAHCNPSPMKITIGKNQWLHNLDALLVNQVVTTNGLIIINHFLIDKSHPEWANQSVRIEIEIISHKTPRHKPTMFLTPTDLLKMIAQLETKNNQANDKIANLTSTNEANLEAFKAKQVELEAKVITIKNELNEQFKQTLAQQLSEQSKYLLTKLLEQLINPLITFEQTLRYMNQNLDPKMIGFAHGFKIIYQQINEILKDYGLKPIQPRPGIPFDPTYHQLHQFVFEQQPDQPQLESQQIVNLITIGYQLYERILKPALVDIIE